MDIRVVRALAASLAAAFVFVAPAEASRQDDQGTWRVVQEHIELSDLLDVCVASFGLSLDYDHDAIRGEVTVRSGPGMSGEAFWRMTNRLIAERKFACIQAPGEDGLTIVPLTEAAKLARVETGSLDESSAGYVKVLHTLTQAEPSKMIDVLGHVLAAEGSLLQAIPEAGQILIAGLKPQVLEALAVVERIDVARANIVVEDVPVENLPPTVIVALLERIGQAMTKVRQKPMRGTVLADPGSNTVLVIAPEEEVAYWRESVQRFDRVQPTTTREYTPTRFGLEETARLIEEVVRDAGEPSTWRLVRDDLTGTLVLTATAYQHDEVLRLMNRLESTPPDAHRSVRSFAIRYRDVDQMLGLVESLVGEGPYPVLDESTVEGDTAPFGTGGRAVPVSGALALSITKDSGTNRLLAIGPPRMLDELGRLIESLDVQQPQVLVEALIVNLTEGQTRELAVELQKLTGFDGNLVRVASLFGVGSASASSGVFPPADGSGIESAVLDPGSFSGVLRALETVNDGRVMTIPKVLVNNHETANLDSVLQTPYASTNASTTVATTSFGGTLDAGTTISVTPQITDGDQLLVDYTISLSSFIGSASDATLPPPRQENRLASVATVPDGYTVVVGGLEIENEGESESRVPWLGAIPLLGNLFKSSSTSTTKTRFFVFLRCSVLRNLRFEDLRHLSADDLSAAAIPPDVPVVLPRLIR